MNVVKFMKERKLKNRTSLIIDNIRPSSFSETSVCESNNEIKRSNTTNSHILEYNISPEYFNDHYTDIATTENDYNEENLIYNCNMCFNKNKDNFMILTCGHIFHIKCLVDNSDVNKYSVIDEEYFNSICCLTCNLKLEIEDILYIHNKFYKNTKNDIIKQDEYIDKLDKQMTKIKDELRVCFEYKQRLQQQREKSKQITVTINTLM